MEFIQNNILLVITAVVSGLMLLWSIFGSRVTGINQVNTFEATRLINDDALVLDVREDSEWNAGHIPDAKHIPLGRLNARVGELDKFKDKPIVVNCRSGHRSNRACAMLKKSGFANVHNLSGGIMAWQQANLPVIKK